MPVIQLRQWFQTIYHLASPNPHPDYPFLSSELCTGCKKQFSMRALNGSLTVIIVGRYRHMDQPHLVGPVVERWHEHCFDLVKGPSRTLVGPVPKGSWKENNSPPIRRDQSIAEFDTTPRWNG